MTPWWIWFKWSRPRAVVWRNSQDRSINRINTRRPGSASSHRPVTCFCVHHVRILRVNQFPSYLRQLFRLVTGMAYAPPLSQPSFYHIEDKNTNTQSNEPSYICTLHTFRSGSETEILAAKSKVRAYVYAHLFDHAFFFIIIFLYIGKAMVWADETGLQCSDNGRALVVRPSYCSCQVRASYDNSVCVRVAAIDLGRASPLQMVNEAPEPWCRLVGPPSQLYNNSNGHYVIY